MNNLRDMELPSDIMGAIQNEISGATDLKSFMNIIAGYAKEMHGGDGEHM
jgi:hypothetical protein